MPTFDMPLLTGESAITATVCVPGGSCTSQVAAASFCGVSNRFTPALPWNGRPLMSSRIAVIGCLALLALAFTVSVSFSTFSSPSPNPSRATSGGSTSATLLVRASALSNFWAIASARGRSPAGMMYLSSAG